MRLIIFLALILIIYYVLRNVAHLLGGKGNVATEGKRGMGSGRDEVMDELVKDPVCGVYVAKKQAKKCSLGGKVIYFCSSECREKYLKKN